VVCSRRSSADRRMNDVSTAQPSKCEIRVLVRFELDLHASSEHATAGIAEIFRHHELPARSVTIFLTRDRLTDHRALRLRL